MDTSNVETLMAGGASVRELAIDLHKDAAGGDVADAAIVTRNAENKLSLVFSGQSTAELTELAAYFAGVITQMVLKENGPPGVVECKEDGG